MTIIRHEIESLKLTIELTVDAQQLMDGIVTSADMEKAFLRGYDLTADAAAEMLVNLITDAVFGKNTLPKPTTVSDSHKDKGMSLRVTVALDSSEG